MSCPSVITAPDPSVAKPSDDDMPKENCTYAVIGGTCFTKKSNVELYMKLEKNTYKLGEKIPVRIETRVEGGSADVDKVST